LIVIFSCGVVIAPGLFRLNLQINMFQVTHHVG
jgi:hypothetical protein